MIGKLTGRLDSLDPPHMVIDVQGVGYVVAASTRTLQKAGSTGSAVALLIETQVREDSISLFGFADAEERDAFRLLTTVQGVGAKVALALLGALGPERLARAIAAQDKATLTEADGVGPKLALRIMTELREKIAALGRTFAAEPASLAVSTARALGEESGNANRLAVDAMAALTQLGWSRAEAFEAIAGALKSLGGDATLPTLLRACLGRLGRADTAA